MSDVIEALRERYSDVHPLILHRSEERADTPGELFDILDTIPDFPIVWSESKRRWIKTDDIYLKENFKGKK